MNIFVQRGKTVSFDDLPAGSVALDGYCSGPAIDAGGRRYSFDHHGECLRHATGATCRQVFDAVLLGFEPQGCDIYLNDLDADSILAAWLLLYPRRAREPLVRVLVANVAERDAHGPVFPVADPALLAAYCAQALKPLLDAKRSGRFQTCDLAELLQQCVDGTSTFVDEGQAGSPEQPPNSRPRYRVVRRGSGWILAIGEHGAFSSLYQDGCLRAVLFERLADGTTTYTIGKRSEFVSDFPVGPPGHPQSILAALAAREPGWGGSTTIGGAPRNADGSRSRLTPKEIFEIVEAAVLRWRSGE